MTAPLTPRLDTSPDTRLIRALLFVLAAGATTGATTGPALAGDCTGPGFADVFQMIGRHLEADPVDTFNFQLQQNAVAGYQVLVPDGAWGPSTAASVCEMLETYAAINGVSPVELIGTEADVDAFIRWMGAMARANLVPGAEAPD
ncbi:MAG: hypothetical protein CSA74_02760 [Rhodobacterales bacterium]|nr:MAG: hypothetical protein CSA74_02760 [Rhodobacterales bacterium]